MSSMRENTQKKKTTEVRRLVLLSGRNEEGALLGEQGVRESGADWTLVRSSFMNQNFRDFTDFARDAAATGVWDGGRRV
jgi:hypothetical protein